MDLTLWELGGLSDRRYSTFSWRAKLALLHKGLPFQSKAVRVSDKAAIAFSGQTQVPILQDGGRVVVDSWAIARYLDETYPDRPSVFGAAGEAMSLFFNTWTDRVVIPSIIPHLSRDLLDCVDGADATHLRRQMEGYFKKPLEDLAAQWDTARAQLRRTLSPARKVVENAPFLAGAAPAYPDYILFGVFQWARLISTRTVLDADDALHAWFERMLDLYDGVGRRQPARA